MKLGRIVDEIMEGAAEGYITNENVKQILVERLLEAFKNATIDELMDKEINVSIVKDKTKKDDPRKYAKYVITLAEPLEIKPLD